MKQKVPRKNGRFQGKEEGKSGTRFVEYLDSEHRGSRSKQIVPVFRRATTKYFFNVIQENKET